MHTHTLRTVLAALIFVAGCQGGGGAPPAPVVGVPVTPGVKGPGAPVKARKKVPPRTGAVSPLD